MRPGDECSGRIRRRRICTRCCSTASSPRSGAGNGNATTPPPIGFRHPVVPRPRRGCWTGLACGTRGELAAAATGGGGAAVLRGPVRAAGRAGARVRTRDGEVADARRAAVAAGPGVRPGSRQAHSRTNSRMARPRAHRRRSRRGRTHILRRRGTAGRDRRGSRSEPPSATRAPRPVRRRSSPRASRDRGRPHRPGRRTRARARTPRRRRRS